MTAARQSFLDQVKQLHLAMPVAWSSSTKHIVTVLFTFASSANGGGICASVGTIARHAGEHERTVERVLRQLREHGLLVDDGWRVFQRPSGDKVRVKSRRLVLSAIARNDTAADDSEPDIRVGFDRTDEPDTGDGLGLVEPDTGDGFNGRDRAIEPDISCTSAPIEPDNACTKTPVEPDTGDTQTKRRTESKKEEPREVRAREQPQQIGFISGPTAPSGATPQRGKATGRMKPIDPRWQPDRRGASYAFDHGVTDLSAEVERFIDWHLAAGKARADFDAAWRSWCRRASQFAANRARAGDKTGRRAAFVMLDAVRDIYRSNENE